MQSFIIRSLKIESSKRVYQGEPKKGRLKRGGFFVALETKMCVIPTPEPSTSSME
jgi:hypothetical protein